MPFFSLSSVQLGRSLGGSIMRCEELQLTTLSASEQQAWMKATNFAPWATGSGNIPILTKDAIESERHLPAILRYRLYRPGLLLYHEQPGPQIARLLEPLGNSVAWWHWQSTGLTVLAAGWPYSRAWDDPQIQEALSILLGGQPITVQITIYPAESASSLVAQVLQQALLAGHMLSAQEFGAVYQSEHRVREVVVEGERW